MNLLQRFFARTPYRNKLIGRTLTAVSGVLTTVETVLLTYNAPVPGWLHKAFITCAIITALWAGYHGQKVKK